MSCPNLIITIDVPGICSINGQELTHSKVTGRCESDMYLECSSFTAVDEYDFEYEEY